jgi:hypothetical protein
VPINNIIFVLIIIMFFISEKNYDSKIPNS